MEVYLSTGRGSLCTCNEHLQTEKGMDLVLDMCLFFITAEYIQKGHRKILMYGQAVLLRHQGTKKVSQWNKCNIPTS